MREQITGIGAQAAGRFDAAAVAGSDTDDVVVEDFRDAATRKRDEDLEGTWWRCAEHGLTQDPIVVGYVPYCPADVCTRAVLLVHHAMSTLATERWNQPVQAKRRSRPLVDELVRDPEPIDQEEDDMEYSKRDVILAALLASETGTSADVRAVVADVLGYEAAGSNRVAAAMQSLKARALVEAIQRGVYGLTDAGLEVATKLPEELRDRADVVLSEEQDEDLVDDDAGEEGAETSGQTSGCEEDDPPAGPDDSDFAPEAAPAPSHVCATHQEVPQTAEFEIRLPAADRPRLKLGVGDAPAPLRDVAQVLHGPKIQLVMHVDGRSELAVETHLDGVATVSSIAELVENALRVRLERAIRIEKEAS